MVAELPTSPTPPPGDRRAPSSGGPGPPQAATAERIDVVAVARDAVHVGVGLGILALQRFQADRPDLEAKLTELGLAPAAWATRQFGELLERQVAALVGAPRPSRRP